jgi:hypothetical protein
MTLLHNGLKTRVRGGARAAMVAATVVAALLLPPSGVPAVAAAAGDISGIWWSVKYTPKLEIEGGGDIPYNNAGRARYAQIMAGLKNGTIKDEARRLCVPDGIPRILGNPYPLRIVHTAGQTTILYELNRVFRVIRMDVPQESAEELEIMPYYSGSSVGHWEGDTLVVETSGFNEKTFLDATGAPHSDQMTTVERIKKINGGRQLETIVTVTDPVMLTRPITARYVYDSHPEVQLAADYVCGEPHRDISKVPGVSEARRSREQ